MLSYTINVLTKVQNLPVPNVYKANIVYGNILFKNNLIILLQEID